MCRWAGVWVALIWWFRAGFSKCLEMRFWSDCASWFVGKSGCRGTFCFLSRVESGVESLECAVWNVQSGVWQKKVGVLCVPWPYVSVGDGFSVNASAPAGNQTD